MDTQSVVQPHKGTPLTLSWITARRLTHATTHGNFRDSVLSDFGHTQEATIKKKKCLGPTPPISSAFPETDLQFPVLASFNEYVWEPPGTSHSEVTVNKSNNVPFLPGLPS